MMGAALAAAACLFAGACSTPDPKLLGTSAVARDGTAGGAAGYVALERSLLARGRLRDEVAPADAPWDSTDLAEDFARIALSSEYRLGGGGMNRGSARGVLRRWTEPVRIGFHFGETVPATRRRADRDAVSVYAGRLRRITGHSVGISNGASHLLILVVGAAELRGLGPLLRERAPDMSPAARRAITTIPPDILCLAVARPHGDPRRGYRGAIVVVRAEHPPRLRRSCIEEELAQAMGLPDDSPAARPSIFNDDEEFGVLTRHDEALLRMLYNPRLRPGMTPAEVAALLPAVAAAAIP
jgi:hypothetical protein